MRIGQPYEFTPEGINDRKISGASLDHLTVHRKDLAEAYRITAATTRIVYRFDDALYSAGKEPHLPSMGLPVAAAHAFARQPLISGLPAIFVEGTWLVRVTEPYWRVIDYPQRSRVLVEPRLSLIGSAPADRSFHHTHWEAALQAASRHAARLGLGAAEQPYGGAVAWDGEPVTLRALYPQCPDAAANQILTPVERHGSAVTSRQLGKIPAEGLADSVQHQMGLAPGGQLVWRAGHP